MNAEKLEKYSCAVTLSDMEVFVFPELMMSLLLANIMSPQIWKWRESPTFKKLTGKGSLKNFMRLKQFIMDEYDFNLDLETWGLTSKTRELHRFSKFIRVEDIAKSNGLFGYEGDKYYFDVDIRKHFGLDAYDTDVIPYWKTETIEAMNAFRYKKGYKTGAGECVSLSSIYAAAAFIVCGIPLEDIYTVLTPLHSQNYIDLQDGIITNNRRIVTKPMWFNGTEISVKAQRALRNEQVTAVSHASGYVHCVYEDATIDPRAFKTLDEKLRTFLTADFDMSMLANFLRAHTEFQKYVQFCKDCHGQARFVKAETVYAYEHGSKFRICDATHEKLLDEIHHEDYKGHELPGRMRCDMLDAFIKSNKIDPRKSEDREKFKKFVEPFISDADKFIALLANFIHTDPNMPSTTKHYVKSEPIAIDVRAGRDEVIEYLESIRGHNETADLAFYAYRDMTRCEWEPFIKAAVERNPVSIQAAKNKSATEAYAWLDAIPNESIYDGARIAQPDEVANYGRGDGIEKAITLANILIDKNSHDEINITIDGEDVILRNRDEYRFTSDKGLHKQLTLCKGKFCSVENI